MPTQPTDHSMAYAVDDLAALLVGVGIIGFALFPLALPLIALTLLLAVPLLAVALVAGLLAAPVVLVRRLARRGLEPVR
jgi:hypothetical protein